MISSLHAYDADSGARVLRIHYSADPEKTSEWAARAKRGMPHKEWQREFELDCSVYEGEPVFPEYADSVHAPRAWREHPAPLLRGASWFGGWDCGTTGLDLAFVLFQVTAFPHQVHAVWEHCSAGPESMETFAPRLLHELRNRFPEAVSTIRHFGDPTGGNRQGATGISAFDVARRHGIVIRPAVNAWHERHSAVVWGLTGWIGEDTPRFLLCASGCPVLTEALRGAYQWRPGSGSESGPGRVLLQPLKNGYSHVADAFQYGMWSIRKQVEGWSSGPMRRFGER